MYVFLCPLWERKVRQRDGGDGALGQKEGLPPPLLWAGFLPCLRRLLFAGNLSSQAPRSGEHPNPLLEKKPMISHQAQQVKPREEGCQQCSNPCGGTKGPRPSALPRREQALKLGGERAVSTPPQLRG